jgi:hypothetical protein
VAARCPSRGGPLLLGGLGYPQRVVEWLLPFFAVTNAIYFSLEHSHIVCMVGGQKTGFTREPPKTKAELREILTEAVRNTQASADNEPSRLPKAEKIATD